VDDGIALGLAELGFVPLGATRRGGQQWVREHNRYLTFTLHHFGGGEIVMTWTFELGEFCLNNDMQIGAAETSFQELYPAHDVRIPLEVEAVRAEIHRTLDRLRFDLGDPYL
jgi:hypothetical protein